MSWISCTVSSMMSWDEFDKLGKLDCKFDELDKLECKFDK